MKRLLCVTYADGETEEWPIGAETAAGALRRRCAHADGRQRPSFAFRGLRARPYWDADVRPPSIAAVCDALEASFDAIEREVRMLCRRLLRTGGDGDSDSDGDGDSDGDSDGAGGGDGDGDSAASSERCRSGEPSWAGHAEGLHSGVWQKLDLWSGGHKCTSNCERLPRTSALIEQLSARHDGAVMLEPPGRCYVSLMLPGTRVAPHCGPTNHRLRLHLPIFLPEVAGAQRLGIVVAGTTREWERGRCLVFDDSFEHEVQLPPVAPGTVPTPRVLLVVDLWHPQAGPLFDRGARTASHAPDAGRFR